MDKLRKLIIFCIIIIIAIIIIICVMLLGKKNDPDYNENMGKYGDSEEVYEQEHEENNKLKRVTNSTEYYVVKNIVDEYFEYINMINVNPKSDLEKEDSNFALSVFKNILNDSYIKEFNITDIKLINDLSKYIGSEYSIDEMYTAEKAMDRSVFLVKVNVSSLKDFVNFIISVDYENNAFEMYGNDYVEKYGYDENEDKLTSFEVNEIEQNSFNKIKSVLITDEDMAINYFNNYKYNILNNIEKAFYSLDEEYRNKRFGSFDEFENYIEENRDIFKDIKIEQYLCNKYDDYKEYVCKDQHENLYIFKEIAVMEYTVKLDTYTITTQKFKEEYEKADVKKKVTMNIGKFIDMINNYDYKSAYAVLNGSFKEKYFKTEDDFKVYMQNKYYKYNEILLDSFSNESGTYVYKGSIKNKLNKDDDTKILNIVMKLKNGIDFEMSFEVY